MEDVGVTRHREKKERNSVKLLQLEVFSNKISTSKIYDTNVFLT